RGVRQTGAGVKRSNTGAPWVRPRRQVSHVDSDVLPGGRIDAVRLDLPAGAEGQIVLQGPAVRFDGVAGKAQVCLDLQPCLGCPARSYQWVTLPTHVGRHDLVPVERLRGLRVLRSSPGVQIPPNLDLI